ncbi:MAG: hypothetical protein ABNG98_03315, partial [Flavobacterium sp.]
FAQVGIETTEPSKTLDVNGEVRIRTTPATMNESAVKDSILVVDNLGNVNRASSKNVINSYYKTFVKGHFSTSTPYSLNLSSGKAKITFDYSEFDVNSEFNTTTNTYTAKQDGIYFVSVQIKANSTVGVANNFGVAITKNGTVLNRNSFANISVLSVNVSPPVRQVTTLIELNTNDTITFEVVSDLSIVQILGNSEDSFFTIYQVR